MGTLADKVGHSIWYLEAAVGIFSLVLALFLLMKKKTRSVPDLLILHLCISELIFVMWSVVNYSVSLLWHNSIQHRIYLAVQFLFGTANYLNMLSITIDRVLAVHSPLRYKILVTKRKFYVSVCVIWTAALLVGIACLAMSYKCFTTIFHFVMDPLSLLIILSGYVYIVLTVKMRNRALRDKAATKPKIKFAIPFCILASFCCFILIPNLVLCSNFKLMSIWFQVVWYLNFIVDPLTYVVITKLRK